jgi:hypothetical protein
MDIFYIIVLGIAIVLLIITLAFIGIGMNKHGAAGAWPPIESTCPDYWTIDPTDSKYCKVPEYGTRNAGSIHSGSSVSSTFALSKGFDASNNRINFNDPYYITCNKQSWAKKWGIYWDGYTNYSGCNK